MRYHDTGPLHLDFHRTLNGSLAWLREHYGMDFIQEVARQMAHEVYRDIYEALKSGNPEPLIEHWTYYVTREGGVCREERDRTCIRLFVNPCPATGYLCEKKIHPDTAFLEMPDRLAAAFSEDTSFRITAEHPDSTGYTLCIQRLNHDSQ
ncbi:MAG: hypothetical protein WD708_00330 [Kiritimatiellia bacterium]